MEYSGTYPVPGDPPSWEQHLPRTQLSPTLMFSILLRKGLEVTKVAEWGPSVLLSEPMVETSESCEPRQGLLPWILLAVLLQLSLVIRTVMCILEPHPRSLLFSYKPPGK